MKAFMVAVLVILCAASALSQSYVERNKTPLSRTSYGTSTFKADSQYVWSTGASRWVTVKISYDTTASMGKAYVCFNNDSTNAIALVPGVGGSYGEGLPTRVYGLLFYRVKGTGIPVKVIVE